MTLISDVINLKKIEYPKYYANLFFFSNIRRIKKAYVTNECNLIHAHYIRDGFYAYWLKKKYNIPYVVTAHAYDILTVPLQNKFMLEITLKVLENSERSIFVSNVVLKKAKKLGYSGRNATVIPNGYDPVDFFYSPAINNSENNKFIGFVGSLIKIKRADYLPEILQLVKKRIGNAKLIVVGQGNLKNKIVTKLEKYSLKNDVSFLGHLNHEQLGKIYNKMDLLIFTKH